MLVDVFLTEFSSLGLGECPAHNCYRLSGSARAPSRPLINSGSALCGADEEEEAVQAAAAAAEEEEAEAAAVEQEPGRAEALALQALQLRAETVEGLLVTMVSALLKGVSPPLPPPGLCITARPPPPHKSHSALVRKRTALQR